MPNVFLWFQSCQSEQSFLGTYWPNSWRLGNMIAIPKDIFEDGPLPEAAEGPPHSEHRPTLMLASSMAWPVPLNLASHFNSPGRTWRQHSLPRLHVCMGGGSVTEVSRAAQ